MEEVIPPSFLGSPPGALVLAPKPQLQLAPNGPVHLMECPITVADPEIGAPPIQDRVQLLDHHADLPIGRKRSHRFTNPVTDIAARLFAWPHQNHPPRLSADSSPGSPPSEVLQTEPAVAPTPPAPLVPFAPAAPCHPRNEPVERCRARSRRAGTIDDLPHAERCWTALAKSLRPEANLDPGESPCLPP